jgi:GT2 family glycosyltransferase
LGEGSDSSVTRPSAEGRVSVAIVNTNTRDLLATCLASLYASAPEIDLEVIVVDNASTDGSVQVVQEQFPSVRVIANDVNRWFTGATNQAIEMSTGEFIFCLNPDTVVYPGTVQALVSYLRENPRVGAVGPRLLNEDGSLQPSCRDFLTSRNLVLQHLVPWRLLPRRWRDNSVVEYWDHRSPRKVDWLIGAALMVRSEVVKDVGLKDEAYPIFHEETDWCYRMYQRGWEVHFVSEALVTHLGGKTVTGMWGDQLVLEFYKGKHTFIRKHYGAAALLLHRFLLAGLLLIRCAHPSTARARRKVAWEGFLLQIGLGGPSQAGRPGR